MNWFGTYRAILLLGTLGAMVAIAAGFLGRVHPAFDTIANFRAHLGVGLVILAVLWSLRCSRMAALLFALAGFLAIAASAPGLPMTSHAALPGSNQKAYRLFAMNLFWFNERPEDVLAAIREHRPDILTLSETTAAWRKALSRFDAIYPHRYRCAEYGSLGGTLILSRYRKLEGSEFCGDYGSLALAEFDIDGTEVAIGSVHLRWPWPASGPRQIDALTPELASIGENALIAGDFNSVTWSHGVARFAEAGGMTVVSGIGPSWAPSLTIGGKRRQLPYWFGLPIDNVMAKGAVNVFAARTLSDAGSDHLPILVEFTIDK